MLSVMLNVCVYKFEVGISSGLGSGRFVVCLLLISQSVCLFITVGLEKGGR
jgi:hypothetical protein